MQLAHRLLYIVDWNFNLKFWIWLSEFSSKQRREGEKPTETKEKTTQNSFNSEMKEKKYIILLFRLSLAK